MTKSRFWLKFAVVLMAIVGLAVLYGYGQGYLPIRPFDSQRWKEDGGRGGRVEMVEWLLFTTPLVGKPRRDVEALLGPGDDTEYFAGHDAVYRLGLERGGVFRIDSEWLVIDYDSHGRVRDVRIMRD